MGKTPTCRHVPDALLPGTDCECSSSCLQGEPLRRYFYGLYSQAELNAFEANMFLAEDRILCIEVVAKKVRQQGRVSWHMANRGAASVAACLMQYIHAAILLALPAPDGRAATTAWSTSRRRWRRQTR